LEEYKLLGPPNEVIQPVVAKAINPFISFPRSNKRIIEGKSLLTFKALMLDFL